MEKELKPEFDRLGIALQDILNPASSNQLQQAVRISDQGVRAVVLRIIQDMLADDSGQSMRTIRRFFSKRDEDWIVPLGYAVARALPSGAMPGFLMEHLLSHEPRRTNFIGMSVGGKTELPSDPLQIVRRADEASDLAEVILVVLGTASSREATDDLRSLLQHYGDWRRNIDRVLASGEDEPDESRSSDPPEPGPILNSLDPQMGRWGGLSERNGRKLTAVLDEVRAKYFYFNLIVSSVDDSELQGPVIFHLNDTFARSVIRIRKIQDGKHAFLEEVDTERTFTVGVQVKDHSGSWISLELDLAVLEGLPKRFRRKK
jgi:hypothetical protein